MAEPSFDAIVVGTGFGGAVTAARLAEGGMRVLVLERGPWWGPTAAALSIDDAQRRSWPRGPLGSRKFLRNLRVARGRRARELMLADDGLFELHRFERLLTLTGSGVGGGSLIYTNIQAELASEQLDMFPPELRAGELAPYYQRVREVLRPSPLRHRPAKNHAFERAIDEAEGGSGAAAIYPDLAIAWGDDPSRPQPIVNAAGLTQQSCNHCGECVLGCPSMAKTTVDQTYVAMALRAGAQLRALSEVLAIAERAPARGGGYELRYVDRRDSARRQYVVAAPKLVLAAGTLNSLRLLFAARDRDRSLRRLSTCLGHGFSPNADLGALLLAAKANLRESSRGPAFNAYLRPHDHGPPRFLIGEAGLPLSALPLPGLVRRLLGTSGLLLAMGADASTGTLGFDGEFLRSEVGRDLDPELFDAIEAQAERLGAAYQPRLSWINAPGGRGRPRIASVHPLGGAAIGRHASEGVVDHRGEVFGHPGLYVIDGSSYPRAPGIPPSMTIAALAERASALMLM